MSNKYILTAAVLGIAVTAGAQQTLRGDSIAEVVVTGTGTQHLLKNAPVQTEVINRKMLAGYAGRSLEDILSGLASSFSFNESDMGSGMQMNGLGNSYILIPVDGKRIHGDVGGENDLSLIDPHNIDRIEIVKGASSALYGSDAIAGVINIITRRHDSGLLIENTTRAGSYGDIRQHNGLAVRLGKVSSYTNFQLQHSDGWQNTSVEDPAQTEFLITDSRNKTVNRHTNWQIAERLTWNPTPKLELYADGTVYWKRIYRPSGKYASCDVKTYDLQYDNGSLAAGGKLKLRDDDFIRFDVDWNRHAYYHYFTAVTLTDGIVDGAIRNDVPYFPGQKQVQSDQRRTMATVKGVFSLPGGNRLSAGAEWRYDYLKAPVRVDDGKVSDYTAAAYVQDEYSPTEAINITAGLRLTGNKEFGLRLTPKISAMLSLGDFRLRGTWSRGFKTPTPKELYYHYVRYMSGTYLYLGNTSLKPQASDYFSIGGEYTAGRVTVTVTGYHNRVDDMINLVTIPSVEAPSDLLLQYRPVKVRQYRNLESAKTYGTDVSVRYAGRHITAGAGYSYLDTGARIYDEEKETLADVTIDGMAHHKANIFAMWSQAFGDAYRLTVGVSGRMSSKRYYQINGNGKGYQIWRINTGHDIVLSGKTTCRVEAGVDNIFNYVDRTPHGLHLGTNTPGTTVYASLTLRFNNGKKLRNNYNKIGTKHQNNEED